MVLPPASVPRRRPSPVVVAALAALVGVALWIGGGRYLGRVYDVEYRSMQPTLEPGDRIFVRHATGAQLGEIVVLVNPNLRERPEVPYVVKRVVARGGDRIEAHDGRVWRNGQVLEEPYLGVGVRTEDFAAVQLAAGQLFVLGDNRSVSLDSRAYGPVAVALLEGQVLARLWPAPRWLG